MTDYPEFERRGPNWALVGIIAAAVVTVGIVVAIFVSTSMAPKHSGLPTTAALSKVSANTVEENVSISLTDTCVYAIVDGVKSFSIWPEGYTRDTAGNVVAPDGTMYSNGGAFLASTVVTTATAAVKLDGGGNDGYIGTLLSQCSAGGSHVAIITKIKG